MRGMMLTITCWERVMDSFSGSWASATWSIGVTIAARVDFFAGETLLYTWTGSITFPLKVSEYNYGSGYCVRGVKWLYTAVDGVCVPHTTGGSATRATLGATRWP